MTVRFRLRELLEERGIGQSEAARLAGVSFATVNRLCMNATSQVSLETLDKLSTVLDVEPGEIIMRDAPRRRSKG